VVIETEIIAKMLPGDSSRVLAALTDMFALVIVVREAHRDENGHDHPITYISSRRVDPRLYLLRLLFLFCDLDDVAWTELLSRSQTPVDTAVSGDDGAGAGVGGEGIANPGQDGIAADKNAAPSTHSHFTRSSAKHHNFHIGNGQDEDEDEDEERRAEAIRKLFRWEASRLGQVYLSASELNSRKSAMPRFQHKNFTL